MDALYSGTFAPGDLNTQNAAGKSCNTDDCIYSDNLLIRDASPAEIDDYVEYCVQTGVLLNYLYSIFIQPSVNYSHIYIGRIKVSSNGIPRFSTHQAFFAILQYTSSNKSDRSFHIRYFWDDIVLCEYASSYFVRNDRANNFRKSEY